MARPSKIWFRKDTGWWMITIGSQKVRLAKGRENRKAAEQKFHELMIVRHTSPDADTARVADLVEAFLDSAKKNCAEDTYRNYRFYGQSFAEVCGKHAVSDLKPFHITAWVNGKPWNNTTERNARRVAKRALNWAKEEGLIASNPLDGMKCPPANTRKRALTDTEFRTIIAASHGNLRILFWALRQTGARPSELRKLEWSEVRADRLVLTKHKTEKKTHKARVIYLTPAMQRLMQFLRKRSTSKYPFVNTRGVAWTTNAIRLAMCRIKEKCNLPDDVCSYLIRHTFGTFAVMNGLNASEVAELMGHTSTQMIDRVYVHLADQVHHLQSAVCRATRPPSMPPAIDRRSDGQNQSP